MIRIKRTCGFCGGDGRLRDGSTYCPHCNTHSKDVSVPLYDKKRQATMPYMEIMANKKPFNIGEFTNYYSYLKREKSFQVFGAELYKIVTSVLKGETTTSSYFIHIDNLNFTDMFVSTYLTTAHKAGLTIFPYLDSLTLHQLRTDRTFKLQESIYGQVEFYDAINSDVLCIDLVTDIDIFNSIGTVMYICSARAKINKPTMLFCSRSGKYLFRPALCEKISSLNEFRKLIKSPKDGARTCNDIVYIGVDKFNKMTK